MPLVLVDLADDLRKYPAHRHLRPGFPGDHVHLLRGDGFQVTQRGGPHDFSVLEHLRQIVSGKVRHLLLSVVKAVVQGGNRVESITIDPEVIDPEDADMLQDLVAAAVNDALVAAQKEAESKMGAITGGMNIPGLF